MLKTVEISRAQKTKGVAVTYRAGTKDNFGTCPATCELNPSGCGATKIDHVYLDAVVDAVPTKGQAFTYSHFSPIHWIKKLQAGKTVINYSAKTAAMAAKYVRMKVPTVCTVAADFWGGRKSVTVAMLLGAMFFCIGITPPIKIKTRPTRKGSRGLQKVWHRVQY